MQFDPGQPLVQQIRQLAGGECLENFVAAALASIGYTVFPDVHIDLDGEDAGQIDVFASLQTPFHESRLLVECKGGEPSFQDIRKFSSLARMLDPAPDECLLICKPSTKPNRESLAAELGVRLVRRDEIVKWILPLVSGQRTRPKRIGYINRWRAIFAVHDYLLKRAARSPQASRHLRFVTHDLWWVKDPGRQTTQSFERAMHDLKDTASQVARAKSKSLPGCLRSAEDDDVEAAMYVELLHRLVNMYAVTRLALRAPNKMTHEVRSSLSKSWVDKEVQPWANRYWMMRCGS